MGYLRGLFRLVRRPRTLEGRLFTSRTEASAALRELFLARGDHERVDRGAVSRA